MGKLSSEAPKALMPLLGVPLLEWSVASLATAGADEIWVNASKWTARMSVECARLSSSGCQVRVSDEGSEPLGTAGALKALEESLTEPFFLVNADILTDIDLAALWRSHATSGAAITLATASGPVADLAAESGWVTQLLDGSEVREGLTYAGISVIDPSVLESVQGGYSSLKEAVLEPSIRNDKGVAAFEIAGYWSDTGTPKRYLDGNLDALAGKLNQVLPSSVKALVPDELNLVGDAVISEGAELRHCVISSGASIAKGAVLERCVVWRGAKVRKGKYKDLIIGAKTSVSAL